MTFEDYYGKCPAIKLENDRRVWFDRQKVWIQSKHAAQGVMPMACEYHKWYAESECGYCLAENRMKELLERIIASKTHWDAMCEAKIALEHNLYKHKAWVHRS